MVLSMGKYKTNNEQCVGKPLILFCFFNACVLVWIQQVLRLSDNYLEGTCAFTEYIADF